jgi:hypothetical protein
MVTPEEEPSSITIAVMLGKVEVRLTQVLEMLAEHQKFFDEVWSRLRDVEHESTRTSEWKRVQDDDRARRPNWVSITSVIITVVSLAIAAGIIGTKGI